MNILSYNVNGLRAALTKGFAEWLKLANPDVIHIQETKAMEEQVDMQAIHELGYKSYWHSAEKKGYSGVATFTKIEPDNVVKGIGNPTFDSEGRMLRLDIGDLTLLNSYFPSGTTGSVRQEVKEAYLEEVSKFVKKLLPERPNIILSGDYNICHKPIDINNPERNKNTSGFLPNEREWMDSFLEIGFVDSFRVFCDEPQKYSWWTYRGNCRERNIGWRIDYHMVSAPLKEKLKSADILVNVVHSDHCPVLVELLQV